MQQVFSHSHAIYKPPHASVEMMPHFSDFCHALGRLGTKQKKRGHFRVIWFGNMNQGRWVGGKQNRKGWIRPSRRYFPRCTDKEHKKKRGQTKALTLLWLNTLYTVCCWCFFLFIIIIALLFLLLLILFIFTSTVNYMCKDAVKDIEARCCISDSFLLNIL